MTSKSECYWNLHKSLFSCRSKGRVYGHRNEICVADAQLVVRKTGRDKVRAERKKNVHAFVRGWEFVRDQYNWPADMNENDTFERITYNPYVNDTFIMRRNGQPVTHADLVVGYIGKAGKPVLWALNP